MNTKISTLEAALLNLDGARLPLLDKLNELNSLIAAEISSNVADLPGTERVLVRAIPVKYNGVGISDSVIVEGSGNEHSDFKRVREVSIEVQEKYQPQKSPMIEKILLLGVREDDLQRELCSHTVVTPLRENHPHSHAYLLVIRESAIYIANVKYTNGSIIKRAGAVPDLLPSLKEGIDCNKFEVTHESRLASEDYMTEFAARRVFEKARSKQL